MVSKLNMKLLKAYLQISFKLASIYSILTYKANKYIWIGKQYAQENIHMWWLLLRQIQNDKVDLNNTSPPIKEYKKSVYLSTTQIW